MDKIEHLFYYDTDINLLSDRTMRRKVNVQRMNGGFHGLQ